MAKDRHILMAEVIEQIEGKNEGAYSGYAFLGFKRNYYDRIKDPQDKTTVLNILMSFLKNEQFDASFLGPVAHICIDLELPGAEDEIERLSTDKRVAGTSYYPLLKALLDQFKLENRLLEEINRMKFEIEPVNSHDLFDRAVTLFRTLRGDVTHIYASKVYHDLQEPQFARSMVRERLIAILKSRKYDDPNIKIKCALILSDLHVRQATHDIEMLLENPHITDVSHLNLIKQAVTNLKGDYLSKKFGY